MVICRSFILKYKYQIIGVGCEHQIIISYYILSHFVTIYNVSKSILKQNTYIFLMKSNFWLEIVYLFVLDV